MPTDQVIDLNKVQRVDNGATHPVPANLAILRE
jgi:hypothetical protein